MVPPDSDRAPPTPPYSGYRLGSSAFRVRGCHPLRRALPGVFPYALFVRHACPTTPRAPRRPRFGLAPFRSPLLGGSLLFSFPPTTGMFRFVGFASPQGDAAPPRGGLPHSDTCGSTAVRASPQTFAACRVLPRLREPRHPPCALARFSLSLVTRSASLRGGVRSCVVSSLCLLSLSHPVKEPRMHPVHALVENVGLEPTTPGLQSRCSSLLSQSPADPCSPGQTRTADPHIISVVL